jgi:predicted phage tail protein
MTKINLHGLLAFEFGDSFELLLKRPKDIFYAIDANRKNFHKRIIELSMQGCHYSIVVDGMDIKDLKEFEIKKQPKTIDLVPVVIGSGGSGGFLTAIGVVAMFVPGLQGVGIALIGMGVSMMLAPKQDNTVEPPKAAVGTASAINQSFYFSNMTAQYPALNRGDWKELEMWSREMALKEDSVRVWMGSVGVAKKIGTTSVPTQCWKVVYVKKSNEWLAFIFDNNTSKADGLHNNKVDLVDVEKLTGFKFK